MDLTVSRLHSCFLSEMFNKQLNLSLLVLLDKFLKNKVAAGSAAGVTMTKLNDTIKKKTKTVISTHSNKFLYNMYRAIMPDKFI